MSEEIQKIKEKISPILKQAGVLRASVFGSVARGEATKDSDVDILVSFKHIPGLISYIRLEQDLSRILKKKVDLVSAGGVSNQLKPYIKKDLIQIYEDR